MNLKDQKPDTHEGYPVLFRTLFTKSHNCDYVTAARNCTGSTEVQGEAMSLPAPPVTNHVSKRRDTSMKKRFLTAALTGLLSAGMVMNTAAAPTGSEGGAIPYSEGTDVYAGVILDDPDAKLKVHVPTLFAFVVNGSLDPSLEKEISVENGNLLLPNVKVAVNEEDNSDPDNRGYHIQTVGDGNMHFENFSTAVDKDNPGKRKGIQVNIKGSIKNEGTDRSRNFWEHVYEKPSDFKQYRLSVEGEAFDQLEKDGSHSMENAIGLEAPDLGNGTENLDAGNFAVIGSRKNVTFGVEVGGTQGNYNQVEESAKVGSIV